MRLDEQDSQNLSLSTGAALNGTGLADQQRDIHRHGKSLGATRAVERQRHRRRRVGGVERRADMLRRKTAVESVAL